MSDKKQFTIGRVEYVTQRSKEIGSNASYKVGVRTAQVGCLCGHVWIADERNGLRSAMGGSHITCPACSADAMVSARDLGL